jgi:hypothetical protein
MAVLVGVFRRTRLPSASCTWPEPWICMKNKSIGIVDPQEGLW